MYKKENILSTAPGHVLSRFHRPSRKTHAFLPALKDPAAVETRSSNARLPGLRRHSRNAGLSCDEHPEPAKCGLHGGCGSTSLPFYAVVLTVRCAVRGPDEGWPSLSSGAFTNCTSQFLFWAPERSQPRWGSALSAENETVHLNQRPRRPFP